MSAHAYEPSEPDYELILIDRWEHERGYPEEQIRAAEDEADRERDRQQEDVDWSEGRRLGW